MLYPNCLTKGVRTSTGTIPRLEKGKYCRVCGFKLLIEKKDRSIASKRAWIVRKEKYGPSGMEPAEFEEGEFFS